MSVDRFPCNFTLLACIAIFGVLNVGCSVGRVSVTSPKPITPLSEPSLNINSATAEELEALPSVGETIARRIVEFRTKNGSFRRPEHLLLVPGISEKRFRQIRPFIRIE